MSRTIVTLVINAQSTGLPSWDEFPYTNSLLSKWRNFYQSMKVTNLNCEST